MIIDSVLVWCSVAMTLFWAMGAYNRLVRLRSQGLVAFSVLEGLFNQYIQILKGNFPESEQVHPRHFSDSVYGNSAAWTNLAAACDQFNASLKVVRLQPLNGALMESLHTAHEILCVSWSSLRDTPADLAGAALPSTLQMQWEHVAANVDMARTEFNRAVVNYNEAINQFPAFMLAWVFGFKSARPI